MVVLVATVGLSLISPVISYGEGLFAIDNTGSQVDDVSAWTLKITGGTQPHCARHPADSALQIRVRGLLPGARIGTVLCADVFVRSDDSRNWWYYVPPAPTHDVSTRACSNVTIAGDPVPTINIPVMLSLPTGYSLIQAELREPDSVGRSALAHAAIWAASPRNGDLASEVALLADAHAVVRQDEHDDRTARRRVVAENAARYEQQRLRRHPRLTLGEGGAKHLSKLLEPSLVAALARARDSPQELWEVLRGTDHVTRCLGTVAVDETGMPLTEPPSAVAACSSGIYTLPVLTRAARSDLVEEILSAKRSPIGPELSMPNNGQDERTERTGVVLNEIGLDVLANELAAQVLAPVSAVTHPEWSRGIGGLDSYYAFSIHVAPVSSDSLEQNDRSSPPSQQWKSEEDSTPNDAPGLRGHIDICEVSMNICLGDERGMDGFSGSAVLFGAVNTSNAASDAQGLTGTSQDLLVNGIRVEHVPGRAFVNSCQHYHGVERLRHGERHAIVVRGLSSAVRRSPAEIFYEQCGSVFVNKSGKERSVETFATTKLEF